MERLVDHDCDPTVVNNQGETALDLACRFGHLEVIDVVVICKLFQKSALDVVEFTKVTQTAKFHVDCFVKGCPHPAE